MKAYSDNEDQYDARWRCVACRMRELNVLGPYMRQYFELVVHVDDMVVFCDDSGHCSLMKKEERLVEDALRQRGKRLV